MTTEMRGRYKVAVHESPVAGETSAERSRRVQRNRIAAIWARQYNSDKCQCGQVRANVVHATDPESEPEGADYYAGWEQHPFAALGEEPTRG